MYIENNVKMCFVISQCKLSNCGTSTHQAQYIRLSLQTVNISSLRRCIRLISDHTATTYSDQIDSLQRSKTLSNSSLNPIRHRFHGCLTAYQRSLRSCLLARCHLTLAETSTFQYRIHMLSIALLCHFSFYFPSNK